MDFLTEEIMQELGTLFKNTDFNTEKVPHPNEDTENVLQQDSGDCYCKDESVMEKQFSLIASKIDELLTKIKKDTPDHLKLLTMKASLLYEKAKIALGKNCFDKSKEHLEKAIDLIKNFKNNDQVSFLYLRLINYLSYVHSRTGGLENAKNILEENVNVDNKTLLQPKVYSTEDLFCNRNVDDNVAKFKLHKLEVNNMQMLGWIYGKLGMTDEYANMVHIGLQKELDINDGDPVQWAVRCYRLASLFLAQSKWQNARYHLTAAQVVLDPLVLGLNPNLELHKAQADLARVWVNYGLHLFSVSKKSILEKVWDEMDINKSKAAEENSLENFTFTTLDINLPDIPVKEINTIQEAKDLFAHTHRWLKRARLFYTLREYPIQYVNIILELSELYRFLAFYEKDIDAQYTIQKKRYEALETLSAILKEVRPNCYAAVSVEIVREIIEIQLDMMSLNLRKLYNPVDDRAMEEEEIKKRIDTMTEIHHRIENLCNEVSNPEMEFPDTMDGNDLNENTQNVSKVSESTKDEPLLSEN